MKTLAITLLVWASFAQADTLRLGTPGYGGTGCPAGSASAVLSPDQRSLSILFDRFVSEAGGSTRKRLDRKTCNIAVPVHVPNGLSVSVFKIDYRGYVSVPRGGQARFNVEYFFAGRRGPRYRKTFRGRADREYLLTNTLRVGAIIWSKCGADVTLRVNSSMLTRTNSRRQEVLATVDSVDVHSGLRYHIRTRRCR